MGFFFLKVEDDSFRGEGIMHSWLCLFYYVKKAFLFINGRMHIVQQEIRIYLYVLLLNLVPDIGTLNKEFADGRKMFISQS